MHHLQTENASITLERVTLVRGSTVVLHDLSLTLNTRRIGLIGDNGAGKSSLFRLICGLDQAQSGRVHLSHAQADIAAPMVGMMFQNPDEQIIFPTVEEELALILALPAASIASTKKLFNDVIGRPPRDCMDYTAAALADAWETENASEGIAAFLGKRSPSWKVKRG